jgi:hypothetical protein
VESRIEANILLMTATITPPPGARALARTDPVARLRDYISALRFYLSLGAPLERIVFCENSGSDIEPLRSLARQLGADDRVEFLVFNGLDFPPEYGRAYGELRLVRHAMGHSRLIREAGEMAVIWKVTGRYIVRNLQRIVATRPAGVDLYFNARRWPRRWIDLYLLAWTPAGYARGIDGLREVVREDADLISAETKVWDLLVDHPDPTLRTRPRLAIEPRIEGVRGVDNHAYQRSAKDEVKRLLRSAARVMIPWLWI